jgi:hypothetical protein
MISKVTDWAEILGLLCLALGAAWLVADWIGVGWALLTFGALIMCMSAGISAVASRRKGGSE